MSKRGRRRNSKRRKSSSSSKQSVSQCIYHKPNKNNSVCEDDIAEKGETDSFRKEYARSQSEDEEKYNSPPKEKRFKYDYQVNVFPNQGKIYTATTNDKEKGVKIVTSVSVDDMDDSTPNITFQQSQEPLQTNPTDTSTSATSIMKINCKGRHVKLQIQELNAVGVKTTFVLFNEKEEGSETIFKSKCERTCIPNNEQPQQPSPNWTIHSQYTPNFSFTFSGMNEPTEAQSHSYTVSASAAWESPSSNQHCVDRNCQMSTNLLHDSFEQISLINHKLGGERKHFVKSYSSDQSWVIPPPPQEFADTKCNTFDDLVLGVASCRIGSCSPSGKQQLGFFKGSLNKSENPFSLEVEERLDLEQLSDSENYDPMSIRPSVSTNRSSFMKEFINCQKRKSWIRNNSIATVEHKACLLPKKRRQTFPRLKGGSLQEDPLMHFRESFSSDTISSLTCVHPQTQRQGSLNEDDDMFPVMVRSNSSTHNKEDHVFVSNEQWRRQSGRRHVHMESIDTDDCGDPEERGDVADSGFDQENGEVDCQFSSEPPTDELSRRALAIQVTPPSLCGSVEQMLQSHPIFSQIDTRSSLGHRIDRPFGMGQDFNIHSSFEDSGRLPYRANSGDTASFSSSVTGETSDPLLETELSGTNESHKTAFCLAVSSTDTSLCLKEHQSKPDEAEKKTVFRNTRELLKPVDGSGCDHWARRRKLFKESKQRSSTGEGSITSDITEGSVSEDSPSLDMTTQDSEEGGFYTETFHSHAWIYQGDNVTSGVIPAGLNTTSRAISIRERTVKINKGTGEYPWGFRIQFSKPIMVTEVDTNGAAEEAGLMVGDYVLAVNGTDVTSIPHSEAADLARQGPDVLTLTIGSDIARGPNTPRPGCRGYLHKRTQSGLIKGWRKRWFVLTHDCCLHYHRHKRDEGKRQALLTIKLEGAEVGPDLSLGKPFVFKCRPLSGNRAYFFCATSNQEMKRWLDALEKAIHPVTQNHVWVDVTRHNSNLPPLAVKNPECLGLLHKIDKIKETWVQHYCILKDSCLYLYSGIRATHAQGGIYLHGYTVREQPYGSKKSTIELKPPSDEFKSFYLCAENPNDNKRWIVAIKTSINKWLPLHQVFRDYNNRPPEETRM